jgi:hypothetical protein
LRAARGCSEGESDAGSDIPVDRRGDLGYISAAIARRCGDAHLNPSSPINHFPASCRAHGHP